ncbi:unnamed protein product, partial [Coregonus sp. 'balchen']
CEAEVLSVPVEGRRRGTAQTLTHGLEHRPAKTTHQGDGQESDRNVKAAIHSQLDGARTGLSQFHYALGDMMDIQNSLADISKDWRQSINIIES